MTATIRVLEHHFGDEWIQEHDRPVLPPVCIVTEATQPFVAIPMIDLNMVAMKRKLLAQIL